MKAPLLAPSLLLFAGMASAQISPEDNDKRPVEAHFYELAPLEPGPEFASTLKLPRGYHASATVAP